MVDRRDACPTVEVEVTSLADENSNDLWLARLPQLASQ